jgi:hypothetical protein
MASSNILRLATPQKTPHALRRSVRVRKAIRRQALTAIGIGLVAVTLTALSLSHLAHGVEIVTGSSPFEAWAMAVGIDLGFVALELSQISIGDRLRRTVARYARPAIVGTLIGSAAMNAFAFAAQADGYCMQAAAVAMGVAIPALIFAMTKVGAALYIDCHSRG